MFHPPSWQHRLPTLSDRQFWSSRRNRVRIELLLVFALIFAIVPNASFASAPESRVLPQLRREAAQQPNRKFRVIVTRLEGNRGGDQQVQRAGGTKLSELPHDAFVAEIPGRAVAALGRNPAVRFVAPDAVTNSTCSPCGAVDPALLGTLYPATTKASSLWPAAVDGAGWTGKGIGVAVLDTGVNTARSEWQDANGMSRVVSAPTFASGVDKKDDGHGHGTHVAGIVAANSWHRSEVAVKGKYVGIAPEATIIDVKVSNDFGKSYISDVVKAIDWVVTNRQTYNIRVMNLSLVSTVAESATTSVLAAAVERAWFNGIFVVVASGNSGPNTLRYPPANDPFVVTVGAADTVGTPLSLDDGIAPWSSYGITQDGYSKPDVVAPGRYIAAPLTSSTSTLAKNFPSRVVDGDYIWMSGTSMAAPVVAGIAALAFQAHPDWTNDQVKWLLMETASPLGGTTPLAGQGRGEADAAAVVKYSNVPLVANQGLPINKQLIGPNGAIQYSETSSSWSSSSWSSSSWSSSSWSSSSWSSSSDLSSTESSSTDAATTDAATTDAAASEIE